MGWPAGWAGFATLAMARSPLAQSMGRELSQLNYWLIDEAF